MILDLSFDLRFGTDTMRWVELRDLKIDSENKAHGELYQATRVRPLRQILRDLNVEKTCVFVDLGSGKGRVLLIAAQFGFKKIIGVEFSHELSEVARKNVEILKRRTGIATPIEIVESDVAQYRIQKQQNIFFMFHPFNEIVMARPLDNIRQSLDRFPRKIWLIYNNPVHHQTVNKAGFFQYWAKYEINGTEFKAYHN